MPEDTHNTILSRLRTWQEELLAENNITANFLSREIERRFPEVKESTPEQTPTRKDEACKAALLWNVAGMLVNTANTETEIRTERLRTDQGVQVQGFQESDLPVATVDIALEDGVILSAVLGFRRSEDDNGVTIEEWVTGIEDGIAEWNIMSERDPDFIRAIFSASTPYENWVATY